MLRFYSLENGKLADAHPPADEALPGEVVWIDLVQPSAEEEDHIERALGIDIPTRDEVSEIQTSSRLLAADGTLYMSALVPHGHAADPVETLPITFVRHGERLVTVRYGHPEAVDRLIDRCRQGLVRIDDADTLLAALLDAVVDRIADRLEAVGETLRRIERTVFRRGTTTTPVGRRLSLGRRIHELQQVIEKLGASHQVVFELRECLASLTRLIGFRRSHENGKKGPLRAIEQDLHAITEHSVDLTQNMEFVLDATVGLIDVQQNKVIYILSIVSVVLSPPVVVASIYGMNFQHMPELSWPWGYAWALSLMLVSAVLPFLIFKLKGWL